MNAYKADRRNRGSDALIRGLSAAGVGRVFTLSGNHIMPVFDAALNGGIELLHTRHEAAAVHMADAFARVSGRVGIAMVTGGPGHANAVSALYTAQMAEAPVVLLSGHAPHAQIGRGAFQEMRQAAMAEPVTKASWVCASAAEVHSDIARAIRIARSGRPGPVHLSLPTDVLESDAASQAAPAAAFEAEAVALAPETAAELMQQLAQARRPIILVGPACLTRAGRKVLAALEAASGIPVVGMESPRGIADPSLGTFAQVLAQADRLLLVGKRLDFTLAFGKAPFPLEAAVHQVDPESAEIERTQRAIGQRLGITAQADALLAIGALIRAARKPASREWQEEVRSAVAYRPAAWDTAQSAQSGRLHPVQMLRPLQRLLDSHSDAVLVCDGGEIGQWASACLSAPHRVINGVAGSIGSGLPYALGARCAESSAPVVAVMGDGTVGFHIAEFDTAVRYRLPFVAVVGNDARWNAEYQIQLRDYGPERMVGCELLPTRYDAVAQAFGAHGACVTEAAQMGAAVQAAHASGLPACINAMIEGVPAPKITR
ncbi:MAG: thiamine pyrophosphate-binding protein [Pseudomonadota bacterium]|nr:thiamine pyrophosphate-binding protein [Pseudomonadota bacterium]